jgi:hypothetical protein
MNIRAPTKRVIEGTLVPGMTAVYLSNLPSHSSPHLTPTTSPFKVSPSKSAPGGFEAVRVEELTLRHYKNNFGYTEGGQLSCI